MKIHWVATIAVLAVGYVLGYKFPVLAQKVGL